MTEQQISPLYRLVRELVRIVYPKVRVEGAEKLPPEAAVVVGNHSQMHGPIACQLYFPGRAYTWCAGEMMDRKTVPAYAFRDFWSAKPRWNRWFYRILSHLIAPLAELVFTNADTIGVYHDSRVLSTFRQTVGRLQEGSSVVIFPEHDVPHNHIISQFQDRFIDVARLYYRRTGKALAFVPMYLAPKRKTMYLGTPTFFRPDAPMEQERQRICQYLMDAVTELACSLPEHVVVPYKNIPKKDYKTNLSKEAFHEETCGGLPQLSPETAE